MMPHTTAATVTVPREMLLTLDDVAAVLQTTPRSVRSWCREGKLEFVKLGKKTLRFKPEWIDDFIERQQRGAMEKRRR